MEAVLKIYFSKATVLRIVDPLSIESHRKAEKLILLEIWGGLKAPTED